MGYNGKDIGTCQTLLQVIFGLRKLRKLLSLKFIIFKMGIVLLTSQSSSKISECIIYLKLLIYKGYKIGLKEM